MPEGLTVEVAQWQREQPLPAGIDFFFVGSFTTLDDTRLRGQSWQN